MSTLVLFVQLLVLAFTGALWWIARRDLMSRIPPPAAPLPVPDRNNDTAELEQLCATLEALVTSLAHRLDTLERRPERAFVPEPKTSLAPMPAFGDQERDREAESLRPPDTGRALRQSPPEPAPDPRYASVATLLEAGITDPAEIARQTGLGRGEVDLILSLRDRRVL